MLFEELAKHFSMTEKSELKGNAVRHVIGSNLANNSDFLNETGYKDFSHIFDYHYMNGNYHLEYCNAKPGHFGKIVIEYPEDGPSFYTLITEEYERLLKEELDKRGIKYA